MKSDQHKLPSIATERTRLNYKKPISDFQIDLTGSKLPQYNPTNDSHLIPFYRRRKYLEHSKKLLTERESNSGTKRNCKSVRLHKPGLRQLREKTAQMIIQNKTVSKSEFDSFLMSVRNKINKETIDKNTL